MVLLIDMDGPLADFEKGFLDAWRKKFPDQKFISLEERRGERIIDQYPALLKDRVQSVYLEKGFYLNLPVAQGSKEALDDIRNMGFDVFVCSSPMFFNPYSYMEKRLWLEKNFGADVAKRLILTKDKTIIKGDILIDDRVTSRKGKEKAGWKLLLFETYHNRNVSGFEKINWVNYREVLKKNYKVL